MKITVETEDLLNILCYAAWAANKKNKRLSKLAFNLGSEILNDYDKDFIQICEMEEPF